MKRFQILFLSCLVLSFTFSIFAQDKDTKEVIILQTSDVHSRIEPVNQKGDEYYNKGGFLLCEAGFSGLCPGGIGFTSLAGSFALFRLFW